MSPTIGELEDTPLQSWGTLEYKPETDLLKPTVFFGLYSFNDFIAVWKHKGLKAILWAGSDIPRFINGYWLDESGKMRLDRRSLVKWISANCENWAENKLEQQELKEVGIKAKVCPSFLGDVTKFEVSFVPGNKVYTSVSGNNFKLYGWNKISKLAAKHKSVEFHLYGNTVKWGTDQKNVIVHGRVSQEQMNDDISVMQGALRLNEHDGFSEILAKSILWGQWPVSLLEYPHMLRCDELGKILKKKEPNLAGRQFYLDRLNNFPWNCHA